MVDLGEEIRPFVWGIMPVNTDVDLTIGETVRDLSEAIYICKHNEVAGLVNQNCPVPKTSGHLSSHFLSQSVKAAHSTRSKRKLDDKKDLNVGNDVNSMFLSAMFPTQSGVTMSNGKEGIR